MSSFGVRGRECHLWCLLICCPCDCVSACVSLMHLWQHTSKRPMCREASQSSVQLSNSVMFVSVGHFGVCSFCFGRRQQRHFLALMYQQQEDESRKPKRNPEAKHAWGQHFQIMANTCCCFRNHILKLMCYFNWIQLIKMSHGCWGANSINCEGGWQD